MSFLRRIIYTLVFASPALVIAAPHPVERDLDSFVATEKTRAVQGILDNLGAGGALAHGAKAGIVIASPSTVNPNYLYTWTRDSALTLKTLIDEFISGNTLLQSHIEDYLQAQAVLQTVRNPSGGLTSGSGLGEPKFNIDGTRFNGAWGRPQRDGPALRAIALMTYINWLVDNKQSDRSKNVVWPVVIKVINDLNYVGQYWNQTGFDLWEEVSGSSFFTIQSQHRALVEGQQVAKKLGLQCPSCESQAPEILCFLQSFWNGQYITANTNTGTQRSGRDVNPILGSIAHFDIKADCGNPTFQPCNSKSLANFKVVVDSFRSIYGINNGISSGRAVAIGRYPEDVYFNGNPWYLATLACAEFLYDAVAQWKATHSLTIDSTSLSFFKEIYPTAVVGKYTSKEDNSPFQQILRAATTYADGFVGVVQKYLPANGSISEQFDRNSGQPLSAYDLTWSYASFVTMAERRAGQYPTSWNSNKAAAAPASCAKTSAKGVYAPATAAGAPPSNVSCTVNVLFRVNASTYFGESIFLGGNTSDLGAWDPTNANPMNPGNYSATRPLWYLFIDLPASTPISYNYIRQESDQSYLYETINRTYTVPSCNVPSATIEDAWVGPTGTPR